MLTWTLTTTEINGGDKNNVVIALSLPILCRENFTHKRVMMMNDDTLRMVTLDKYTYELRKDILIYHNDVPVVNATFKDKPDKLFIRGFDNLQPDKFTMVDRGLFILYMSNRFHLPFCLWDRVDIKFMDEDSQNYRPENLYVFFKEQIPNPDLPGFYYIPGYELNSINELGHVYCSPSNKMRIPEIKKEVHVKENSYVYCSVNVRKNKTKARLLHRLLALVFKNPPENYPKLVVDHVNSVKYDFSLGNIEWVSYKVNNTRARELGLRTDNKEVDCLDTFTGVVKTYLCRNDCARDIGVTEGTVSSAFTSGGRVVLKRYKLRNVGENLPWDDIIITAIGNNDAKAIKTRNVFTGVVTHYPSIKRAMKVFESNGKKLHLVSVTRQVKNEAQKLITCDHEFKYDDDNSPWHEFTHWDMEVARKGLNVFTPVYKLTDVTTNESNIYFGWQPINKLLNICKRTIIMAGVNNGLLAKKYKVEKLR